MEGKRLPHRKYSRGRRVNVMVKNFDRKWIEFSIRWIIGLTFIVASIHKIVWPAEFAKILYGYDLFPHFSINLIAILLPFVELVTGLSLILNIYSRAAATLAGIMLAGFTLAISINMARGHEFDCGCFSFGSENPLTGNKFLLIRDIFLLVLCIFMFRFNGKTSTKQAVNG